MSSTDTDIIEIKRHVMNDLALVRSHLIKLNNRLDSIEERLERVERRISRLDALPAVIAETTRGVLREMLG